MDDYAQFAQTCQDSASGTADACGPKSPDSHRAVWGLTSRPPVSPSGFPPVSRPSSALRFLPFGRHCPVPFPRRFPSGILSLSNLDASTPAGRFRGRWSRATRTKVTSSAATTSPGSRDPPALQMAATGHDGMPPQNRLICAGARAMPSRLGPRAERRIPRRRNGADGSASRGMMAGVGGHGRLWAAEDSAARVHGGSGSR